MHIPGFGVSVWVPWVPMQGGEHIKQPLQTGVRYPDASQSGVKTLILAHQKDSQGQH